MAGASAVFRKAPNPMPPPSSPPKIRMQAMNSRVSWDINNGNGRRFLCLSLRVERGGREEEASIAFSSSRSYPYPSKPKTKLFVSGLSFHTTEESLRNAFKMFGQLVEVNLVMDKIAKRPRGFAFIRYTSEEESEKAIEGMHGKLAKVVF